MREGSSQIANTLQDSQASRYSSPSSDFKPAGQKKYECEIKSPNVDLQLVMSKNNLVPIQLVKLKAPSKYDQDDVMFKPQK